MWSNPCTLPLLCISLWIKCKLVSSQLYLVVFHDLEHECNQTSFVMCNFYVYNVIRCYSCRHTYRDFKQMRCWWSSRWEFFPDKFSWALPHALNVQSTQQHLNWYAVNTWYLNHYSFSQVCVHQSSVFKGNLEISFANLRKLQIYETSR